MQRTYTVPIGTFVILGVLSFGLSLLLVLAPVLYSVSQPSSLRIVGFSAIAFGIPAAIMFWLSRFRLVVTSDALAYSSLFSGQRTIRLSDVTAFRLVRKVSLTGGVGSWIEVETADSKLAINYKVFSREAQQDLFLHVRV